MKHHSSLLLFFLLSSLFSYSQSSLSGPVAGNVTIKGKTLIGQTLTGVYKYYNGLDNMIADIKPVAPGYVSASIYNGTPYIVYGKRVAKFNGTSWQEIGGDIWWRELDCQYLAIGPDGTPYVAFRDWNGDDMINWLVVVMKYTGKGTTGWEKVGASTMNYANPYYITMAIGSDNIIYVSFANGSIANNYLVLKYTEPKGWVIIGELSYLMQEITDGIALDDENTPYVLHGEIRNCEYAVLVKLNGVNWEKIGVFPIVGSGAASGVSYLFINNANQGLN